MVCPGPHAAMPPIAMGYPDKAWVGWFTHKDELIYIVCMHVQCICAWLIYHKITLFCMHLCVMSTNSSTAVWRVVIILIFIVPIPDQASVVCWPSCGCKVLPNRAEGNLLGHPVVIVLKHTLLSVVLGYCGQFCIPNLRHGLVYI